MNKEQQEYRKPYLECIDTPIEQGFSASLENPKENEELDW